MAVGFFSEGVCFALQQEAIDAHFQSIPPTILTTTTTQTIAEYIRLASGVWNLKHSTQNATGVSTQQYSVTALNPVFGSCTTPDDPTTSFNNGVELGWAVSGVIVIAYCLYRLRRGF